jgi:hypothetical protein
VSFGKIIWMAFKADRFSFDKFKSGGLHEKHAVAIWNMEIISASA